MNTLDAIATRRHIKKFKPDPVSQDLLHKWLSAASFAPNHRMIEPWKVIVVGPATRAALNHGANFGDAPVVLAFLSQTAENPVDRDENFMAVSAFIQNFCLAAWSEGVGTRWTSIGTKQGTRDILEVPDNYEVVEILGVGYPEEVPLTKERTPITSKLDYRP